MIGERQVGHRRALRHVAGQTVLVGVPPASRPGLRWGTVTTRANRNIGRFRPASVFVRIMAAHASQNAAPLEAGAGAQSDELKTNRRRILRLRLATRPFRHPVAFRTQFHRRRPPQFRRGRSPHVIRSRTVAPLARHPRGHRRQIRPGLHARGVALEAPRHRGRILPDSQRCLRARRWCPAVADRPGWPIRFPVVGEAVFDEGAAVTPHGRHGLGARSKCPSQNRLHPLVSLRDGNAQAVRLPGVLEDHAGTLLQRYPNECLRDLGRRHGPQRPGVLGGRLRGELQRVAGPARRRPYVTGSGRQAHPGKGHRDSE